jgi:hypothetical protein
MLTLFNMCILSKWEAVVRPLFQVQPYMVLCLVVFVVFTTYGIMNLVIGNMVECMRCNEQKIAEIGVQLNDATNALHLARDERSRLSADVQALQREKVALEDLIKNLRADWNTVLQLSGRDEGAEERRTQELWQPYIKQKASDFSKRKGKSELEFLDDSENYLRSKKLYFPKRVLRAFHTSLKVTDISPLVVLAGISGTGKSELPRRYAEAMGLHFLNVAVQPRWDSPQDMFGFFNYLEIVTALIIDIRLLLKIRI